MRESAKATQFLRRAAAVAIGVGADRVIGDPQRYHPVAGFGSYVSWLEKHLYQDSVARGAVVTAAATIPPVVLAVYAHRQAPMLATAVALWASLGGTTLARVGRDLGADLEQGDDDAARQWMSWLCSRDPNSLDAAGMARAGVESLAENTCDAVVAPLVWAAVFGAPGVVAHRAINTLDAMLGYHNDRYECFGKVAAITDDIAAYIPARLTAVVHTAVAGSQGRFRQAVAAWNSDAPKHPSPNAGPVEATAAAALNVQLGGTTHYPWGVEERPTMGKGKPPTQETLVQAVRLIDTVTLSVTAGSVLALLAAAALKKQ